MVLIESTFTLSVDENYRRFFLQRLGSQGKLYKLENLSWSVSRPTVSSHVFLLFFCWHERINEKKKENKKNTLPKKNKIKKKRKKEKKKHEKNRKEKTKNQKKRFPRSTPRDGSKTFFEIVREIVQQLNRGPRRSHSAVLASYVFVFRCFCLMLSRVGVFSGELTTEISCGLMGKRVNSSELLHEIVEHERMMSSTALLWNSSCTHAPFLF